MLDSEERWYDDKLDDACDNEDEILVCLSTEGLRDRIVKEEGVADEAACICCEELEGKEYNETFDGVVNVEIGDMMSTPLSLLLVSFVEDID